MAGLSADPPRGAAGSARLRVVRTDAVEAGEPLVVEAAPDGATIDWLGAGRARLLLDGVRHDLLLEPVQDGRPSPDGATRLEVVVDGWRFDVQVERDDRARLRERATADRGAAGGGGPLELRAIIPGRIVSVDVADGDPVEAGGRLLVIEAMKMQNELRAPRAGAVRRLAVGAGQTVERGDLLLVVE